MALSGVALTCYLLGLQEIYTSTLDELGVPYDVHDAINLVESDLYWVSAYPMAILFSGANGLSTEEDMTNEVSAPPSSTKDSKAKYSDYTSLTGH